MTKRAVFSPFYPISDKLDTSHRAGWARYWAEELGADILPTKRMGEIESLKKGDELLAYHGMEFKGALNLQSGLTDEIIKRIDMLLAATKRGVVLHSLDIPWPNYGKLLGDRGLDPDKVTALSKLGGRARMMGAPEDCDQIILGDSHALSMYVPDSMICRNDSVTLHGALKIGLWEVLDRFSFESNTPIAPKKLTVYFGNIDIRHHLARQPDPIAAIKELVTEYGKQLYTIASMQRCAIEVVLPLPIEDESRAIPKSGWYKGAPFFGDWSMRHNLRLAMREELKRMVRKHKFTSYEHPKHFIQKDGKLSFDVMELPRSVHIRPSEYRLKQEGMSWSV